MSLIDQLPTDQSNLIVDRLGISIVREFEGDITNGETKTDTPDLSRFYWRCVKAMGQFEGKLFSKTDQPTAAWAWQEVINQRGKLLDPDFSHPAIAETVNHFGGWSKMWAELNDLKSSTQRKRFMAAYKDLYPEH